LFDGRWRAGVDRGTKPLGTALQRTGITANQLTAVGLVVALAAAWAIGSGHLLVGLVLVVGAAVPDLLDGPVAKASGTTSRRGAFLDSVTDRVTDALLLGGVAWYLGSTRGPHAPLLAFAVFGAASLVSYERSKAESLGFQAKGGLMERAERIVALSIGLLVPVLLVPALWVMLALSLITAVQRFAKVWRQSGPASAGRDLQPRWTMAAVEARWRARREALTAGRRAGVDRRFRVRRQPARGGRHRARTRP